MAGTPQPEHNHDTSKALVGGDIEWNANYTEDFKRHLSFSDLLAATLTGITGNTPTKLQTWTGDRLRATLMHAIIQFRNIRKASNLLKPDQKYEEVILQLNYIADNFKAASELVALEAVQGDHLTRRKVAELLNVHENTIGRWLKDYPTWEKDITIRITDRVFDQIATITGFSREQINTMRAADKHVWHNKVVLPMLGDNIAPPNTRQDS